MIFPSTIRQPNLQLMLLMPEEPQDAQKGQISHPPTPARRDAPFRRQGRSELSLKKGWLG